VSYNRVAHEFELAGSFICDIVVGDWERRHYAFIEFEDAAPKSMFTKRERKKTPEWSRRFEHGFSQLADLFFLIDDVRHTADFQTAFGTGPVDYVGLLILGRDETLGVREERRLKWRESHVQINSKKIYCKTFDQLYADLLARLQSLPLIERTP